MTNLTKYICLFLTATSVAAAGTVDAAARLSVKASTDSTTMIQASKAVIKVEVSGAGNGGSMVALPEAGQEYNGIEISSVTTDTTAAADGTTKLVYDIAIQPFEPGTFTLPPFEFAAGSDTARSEALTLKVIEVDLDSLTDINPMESIVSVNRKWYDYIPDWTIWILVGILAAIIAIAAYMLLKRDKLVFAKKKKETPPYDLAVMRLNELQAKKLPQSGRDKEYYTELTDILRQYLEGRFGINAMEMSSTQIIYAMRHNAETKPGSDLMKQVLEIADFVKFAKVRPLPDDNVKSFNSALKFVEDSKPLPPVEETEGDKKEQTDKK